MRRIWRFFTKTSTLAVVSALAAAAYPQSEFSNRQNSALEVLRPKKINVRPADKVISTAQLETYRKLLGDAANDPVLLNNLGVRFAQAKRYNEAAELIEKAVEFAPRVTPILVNLAVVDINLGIFESALDLFERAQAIDPGYERINSMLCDTYTNAIRHREAVECFEKRAKTTKMDNVSLTNFSLSLIELGETKRATRLLRDAAASYPNNQGVMNALGIALYRGKNYSESASVLTKLVQMTPSRPQFRFNLAVAQMAASNRTAAIEQYNILKRSDPDLARSVYNMLFRDKLLNVGNK